MPCGGIFPAGEEGPLSCFLCRKQGADVFVLEWDAYLHSGCVRRFLRTEEGQTVVQHRHVICFTENNELITLQEEGELNESLRVPNADEEG